MSSSSPPDSARSAPGDYLVDWANFESILAFTCAEENPEVLQGIIRTYRTDAAAVLDELQAIPPDNHAETRRHLHKLKGSSGSLALMGVVDTIRQLHDPVDAPPTERRAQLLGQIRQETELALAALFVRYPWLRDEPA